MQVSQPTVVRFVQAMGFDGYRSFKYCLLRDRSGKSPQSPYFDPMGDLDLKPWDCLEDLPLKETRMAGGLLEDTLKLLSTQGLSRAVRMLATARTIDIYGVENSFTPASDLLTKLTYLGLNCRMHTDAMMNIVVPQAAQQGYAPDFWISPDGVDGKGRPNPYMIFANMKALGVSAVNRVVKVGDTVSDVLEGVIEGSSELGLSQQEYEALDPQQRQAACRKPSLSSRICPSCRT